MRGLLSFLRVIPHYIVMIVRAQTGRLYVARDRPDWVLAHFAGITNGHAVGPDFQRVVADCARERDLRAQRRQRETEMQNLQSAAIEAAKQGQRP
jgi:hypothetical protein